MAGATAVFQCYGLACQRLLRAAKDVDVELNPVYHGWLQSHADRWPELGKLCGAQLILSSKEEDGYVVCLSMLCNWIDAEAANTGMRADLKDPTYSSLLQELECLEPGYAVTRDKHQSFVADVTGVKTKAGLKAKAISKVDKAAEYLVAKNNKHAKLDAAAAYLAAKKKKDNGGI